MERKKEKKKVLEEKARLIGIGGIGPCVGCTHFAIMLLNYLAGYRRRKAALLEWNRSGDFEKLEKVCTGKIHVGKPFHVLDGIFYKAAGQLELEEVLNGNYDDILLDFGALNEEQFSEFLRCEKQFVIGSFSEWQEDAVREFARKHGAGKKSWTYLTVFGSEETRKEFMRRPGLVAGRIPFSADAFSVTKECSQFFERIV